RRLRKTLAHMRHDLVGRRAAHDVAPDRRPRPVEALVAAALQMQQNSAFLVCNETNFRVNQRTVGSHRAPHEGSIPCKYKAIHPSIGFYERMEEGLDSVGNHPIADLTRSWSIY